MKAARWVGLGRPGTPGTRASARWGRTWPWTRAAPFRYAVRLIADAGIDVSPLLSHMLPIEEVGEAFRIARMRTGNALKVSVKF